MRLIDADALIEAHYDYCCKHHGEADVFYVWSLQLMKNAPTIDAVEVVRCRKCKYYSADDPDDLKSGYCDYWYDYHYENDFCNYGGEKIMKYAVIGRTFDAIIYKTEDEARKALYNLPEAMLKYDGEVALAKADKGARYWTVIEEAYTGGEEYEAEW